MRVLLVEPAYKNKYPPIGLMKISTYHKKKGDYVFFVKGQYEASKNWDRIYITTLFTFDFDEVVKTIRHYQSLVNDLSNIYVGGILASLMPNDLRNLFPGIRVITGRLTSSSILGFFDDVNIDKLPLDYDILELTNYKYNTENCVISYTSRGCINKCLFCAVPKLEGNLSIENSITNTINSLRNDYCDRKDLLLLDNNILGFDEKHLSKLADDLNSLGFINTPTFRYPNKFLYLFKQYHRLMSSSSRTLSNIIKISDFLTDFANKKNISSENRNFLIAILNQASNSDDFMTVINENFHSIHQIVELHTPKKSFQRYVDFNQGLDARELTEEKMKILARIPIKPYRFAFDSIAEKEGYCKAVRLAAKYGINTFSNYLLYNFLDSPEDLYQRIIINLELSEELHVKIYSFPMKYASIKETNRSHVGNKWNLHYLRIFQSIINVTKGVVAGDRSFIERAFGSNFDEFFELLHMPHDFIVYRNYFESLGYTKKWKILFDSLTDEEKNILVESLDRLNYHSDNSKVNDILQFYKIRYKSLNK